MVFMSSKTEATKLLIDLVKARSEPGMSKEPVLGIVVPKLEGLGFKISRLENNDCPVIFATRGKPVVLLSGHLDTVDLGKGWTREQGELVGDRIYGRGALDMKGPCVSMLLAAEKLIQEGIGLALAFTTDEEVGMMGAELLAREHPEISTIPLIIICEPTDMRPATEEKGVLQFRVDAWGKNAHASMPELGSNAISRLVFALQELLDSELFGSTSKDNATVNVGNISGGNLINVVPESASAEIDIRFSADHTNAEMLGIVKKLLRTDDDFMEIEVLHELPPFRSGLSTDTLNRIEDYLGAKAYGVPYGTEMVKFGPLNPKIFILGPGIVEVAHQPDEWIDINEVLGAALVYVEIANIVAKY